MIFHLAAAGLAKAQTEALIAGQQIAGLAAGDGFPPLVAKRLLPGQVQTGESSRVCQRQRQRVVRGENPPL